MRENKIPISRWETNKNDELQNKMNSYKNSQVSKSNYKSIINVKNFNNQK